MMTRDPQRVLYILHAEESGPPAVLRQAAKVISFREGGVPDISALDNPPRVIVVGPPFDEEMQRALTRLETLELPFVGIGTGKAAQLDAHVSRTISPEDLAEVLNLVHEHSALWHLDCTDMDHPMTARWLGTLTDSVTRMIEHLMTLRIPEYRKRTDRVVQACLWIGTHLGMSETDLGTLLHAARLREIGKLGLPDRILFAARADRSAVDQRLYDRYPALGAQAMAELPSLKDAAWVIECQLENFDGSGPAELASHQIPLASRILRVASAYEMVYYEAPENTTGEEIMAILGKGQGSLYDPLLLKLVQNYHYLTSAGDGEARRTRRVRLADLVEGMELAEDIWSRNGMKIVPHGTRVTENILRLLQSGPLDSTLEAVEIFAGSSQPAEGSS